PNWLDDAAGRGLGPATAGAGCGGPNAPVLHPAEPGECLYQLKRASDPGAAALVGPPAVDARAGKPHLAGIGSGDPGDHVETGSLARSVGPNQADDGALRHAEADVLQGP